VKLAVFPYILTDLLHLILHFLLPLLELCLLLRGKNRLKLRVKRFGFFFGLCLECVQAGLLVGG
jgi:hypothetical protein